MNAIYPKHQEEEEITLSKKHKITQCVIHVTLFIYLLRKFCQHIYRYKYTYIFDRDWTSLPSPVGITITIIIQIKQ